MAKIINKTNHLRKEVYISLAISLLKIIVGFCGFLWTLGSAFQINNLFYVLVLLILFSSLFASGKSFSKFKILLAGLDGEKTTMKILSRLSDDYSVLTDLEIEFEGQKSQLDTVVVGPNGVFVIETKNIKGNVVSDFRSNNIKIGKIGKGGNPYYKDMYNPTKQVATHTYRLSKVLKQHELNSWVQGLVFFSHHSTKIPYISSSDIPVISLDNNYLVDYITNYKSNYTISYSKIDLIVCLLENYVIKK